MWWVAIAAQLTTSAFSFAELLVNQDMPSIRTSSSGGPKVAQGGASTFSMVPCFLWHAHGVHWSLGSWPGSILNVPFPCDDGTLLGLSSFISGICENLGKNGYLRPQGHIRCFDGEMFGLYQRVAAVERAYIRQWFQAAVCPESE